jgi:hypothetical protein
MTTDTSTIAQPTLSLREQVIDLEFKVHKAVVFSQRFNEQLRAGDDEEIRKALTCKYEIEHSLLSDSARNELYQQAEKALSYVYRNKGWGVLPQG